MKNLRKSLSFILVLAMVLGMATTAFAATTFTDESAITNVEAATVLNKLQILEGFSDGSFGATKSLTRGQGAAIIARMMLGRTEADKLVAVAAPFSDVAADSKFAGYIAYCAAEGIIDGYADGTFRANATLTVAQFAKMCLTALGYDSDVEGFTGSGWANKVSKVGQAAGLFKGITASKEVCTRDAAAQLAFNALQANTVTYTGGATTTVTAGDAVVTFANSSTLVKGGLFLDQHYDQKLTKAAVAAGSQTYGRPAEYEWIYDGTAFCTANSTSTLLATYEGAVTKGTTYALLASKFTAGKITDWAIYVDGVEVASTAAFYWASGSTETVSGTGIGVTTEIYYDSTTLKVTACMYGQYLVKATKAYDVKATSVAVTTGVVSGNAISGKDFPVVQNAAKGDYFVITKTGANNKVVSVTAATKVTGKINSFVDGKSVKIDGTDYSYSKHFVGTANSTKTGYTIGGSIDYILDRNGALIDVVKTDVDYKLAYVCATKTAVGYNGATTVYASVYDVDGVNTSDVVITGCSDLGWYKYTVNEKGAYVLTTTGIDGADQQYVETTTAAINGGKAVFASTLKASNDTKFIVLYTKDGTTTVSTYTGYSALPTYADANTSVAAIMTTEGGFATNVIIKTAVAAKEVATAASDYVILVTNAAVTGTDDSKVAYKTYTKAIINGSAAEFTVPQTGEPTCTYGVLYKIAAKNAAGYVTTLTASSDLTNVTTQAFNAGEEIKYANGVLDVNDQAYELATDVVVYVISGAAFTTMDASAFATDYTKAGLDADMSFVLDANKLVTTVYAAFEQ